jgi:hypothetical protein
MLQALALHLQHALLTLHHLRDGIADRLLAHLEGVEVEAH